MNVDIIELVPGTEVVREVLTTPAEQGPPGPPGPAGSDDFDLDLSLIYQTAKL